jgi:hypothetical protein
MNIILVISGWYYGYKSRCRKQGILTNLKILNKIYHPILKRHLTGQNKDRAAQCSSFSQ